MQHLLAASLFFPNQANISHGNVFVGLHKDVVRGVRWLGCSPLIVSFSTEKLHNGFCNALLLTDVRSRASVPFRSIASESSSLLGVRASASGHYLLLLFRAAPSEIWQVAVLITSVCFLCGVPAIRKRSLPGKKPPKASCRCHNGLHQHHKLRILSFTTSSPGRS